MQSGGERHFVTGGLWVVELESGRRQRLLPDFRIQHGPDPSVYAFMNVSAQRNIYRVPVP